MASCSSSASSSSPRVSTARSVTPSAAAPPPAPPPPDRGLPLPIGPRLGHNSVVTTWSVHPEQDPPKALLALAEQVERDGGLPLALYREPVGDHWHIFCLLPMGKVEPTPYQRDLSPTHAKRLQEVVKKIDRFVDPIVVMSPKPGLYWTPNGNHRRTVLQKLKATMVPGILVPEAEVAFQILALNTEKAHNLKEKSLGDPHVSRAGGRRAGQQRGRLRVPVRGSPLHHPGSPLREEQALRGRGFRADPAPRGQI